jgi:hypothetical protein
MLQLHRSCVLTYLSQCSITRQLESNSRPEEAPEISPHASSWRSPVTSSALLPFRSSLSRGLSRPPAHDSLTQQPLRPGLLRRILEAVAQANQRRAERVIAAYVARNGGRLTDSLERRNERSFL